MAIYLSIFTLLKTLYSDFRTSRRGKWTDFDSNVGSALRIGLRAYDKSLTSLRTFSLANPRALAEQRDEVEKLYQGWLDATFEIARLLGEVDDRSDLACPGWQARFEAHSAPAEDRILMMIAPSTDTTDKLRDHAREAFALLTAGMNEVRTSLQQQQRHYDGVFDKIGHVLRGR